MTKLPSDVKQREQALNPTRSFICEAPAGSGKTELLTQRFLNLLGAVERPEQVLAITFTRKAAGEMHERVFTAIQSGLAEKPDEAHKVKTWELANKVIATDAAKQWHLLENPNRLQIKTFDSLCASLANALPLESSFGAKPQVCDESEELYQKAARALLHSLEDNVPWCDSLSILLSQLDNKYSRLESLLTNMLARREEWAPLINYQQDRAKIKAVLEANLQSIIQDTVNQVKNHIPDNLGKELIALTGFAANNLKRANVDSPICDCANIDLNSSTLPGHSNDDIKQWRGMLALLTKKDGQWRARLDKNCGFPAGENAAEKQAFKAQKQNAQQLIKELANITGLLDSFADLDKLPNPTFNVDQWDLLDALFEVLPVLVAQLTVAFKESNTVDFAEISIKAREALGQLDDPTQLALKLDYQIQHILVDEFQDTSFSQVDLLQKLTAGWQPGDGKTLFCVGDAMQSIYGFRGANVGLFLHCREHGLENAPLTPLKLTTNFRSQAGVVNWVNKTFASAFPAENDISRGAVIYSNSEPFHHESAGQAVHIHGMIDQQDLQEEARVAVDIIQQTRQKAPDNTIAILVRNRNHASEIAKLLKSSGLKYRAVELEPLQDHGIIQDLMALTQALLHPADRTAWLAVLRAPWCGLSLVDLEAIANLRINGEKQLPTILTQAETALHLSTKPIKTAVPEQSDLFASNSIQTHEIAAQTLTMDGKKRLLRCLPILRTALDNKDRKTFRLWIEGLWIGLGGPACLQHSAALSNAEMFFDLIEKWPYSTDLTSLEQLKKSVQKLFAAPDPEADDKIQIMTIHKSKGLEFDTVIVPALHKTPRRNDPSLLMWHQRLNQQGQTDLIMAPITATGSNKHPAQSHLQTEENKKAYYEACRLLYVACTRAKQELHLFANLKSNEKDQALKEPSKTSLLHAIWRPVQLQVQRHESDSTNKPGHSPNKPTPNIKPLQHLPTHWQQPDLPSKHLLDNYIPRYQYNNANNTVNIEWKSPTLRHVGTIIHRYLQLIGEAGIKNWSIERVQQRHQHITSQLKFAGVPAADLQSATDKVLMALKLVIQDDKAQEILSDSHPFHGSEYPITFNSRVGPKHLVIDRIYTTRADTTWVVDYKTAAPDADQPLEDFLQQQKEHYESQLKLYQTALQQAGFNQVKTALYFPLITYWLPLDQPIKTEETL